MIKNIILIGVFISGLFCLSMNAQNPAYKTGISFKKLFMDYQSQNGGDFTSFRSYHHGFEVGFHYKLTDNIFLNAPLKIGVVRSHDEVSIDTELSNCLHKAVYGVDAKAQYIFNDTANKVLPYVTAGIGGVTEVDGDANVQIPVGAGLYFHIRDNLYINIQSEYRLALADDRNNLHHAVGFVYQFKPSGMEEPIEEEMMGDGDDSDGDGLDDEVDLCPQEFGAKEMNGCPDKDGDGIADYKDECPNYAGLKALNGCPDTDGDGLSDNDDECPNMVGPIENKGCPNDDLDNDGVPDNQDQCPNSAGTIANNGCPEQDQDKDGVIDNLDRCPNIFGLASAKGCPDSDNDGIGDIYDKCPTKPGLEVYEGCPDTDGDGIADYRDGCPSTFGPVGNNGCPEIERADREVLELAMRAVQFDTGKNTLKPESYDILGQIVNIMNKYPDYRLSIEGHTDSTGDAGKNQSLSERRAKSCLDYLVSKGISSSRMSHIGYGEVTPIADNSLLSGRALNRRVEFNLSPGR